ncbi:epithelial membrane protein 2-like [Scleropages formosus]|uniref:Epithelial membrane protein 2-like n=1 Tax=Scleropages formosus TaxID=113540 RepID=A0A0P7UQG0_SCLFO|nr:epithelial membrane protein 2-like [Scleropages formosus]
MITMLVLLALIFLLHIATITLLLAATINNGWWVTDTMSTDVWARWVYQNNAWNYTSLPTSYPQGLCIMIAASIYTDIFHKNEQGSYGPSFILAWISFALSFISSVVYFVLRKKTA